MVAFETDRFSRSRRCGNVVSQARRIRTIRLRDFVIRTYGMERTIFVAFENRRRYYSVPLLRNDDRPRVHISVRLFRFPRPRLSGVRLGPTGVRTTRYYYYSVHTRAPAENRIRPGSRVAHDNNDRAGRHKSEITVDRPTPAVLFRYSLSLSLSLSTPSLLSFPGRAPRLRRHRPGGRHTVDRRKTQYNYQAVFQRPLSADDYTRRVVPNTITDNSKIIPSGVCVITTTAT